MSATATMEATKARSDEATKGKCTCAKIRDAMADGVHNPEAVEEYRAAHGHYEGCPLLRPRPESTDEPIFFIHRRRGVKYDGQWYNSPIIQRYAGSGVFVRKAHNANAIFILDLKSEQLGVGFPAADEPAEDPLQHSEFSIQNSPPFVRLGAYECVHPASFEVGPFGVMVNGQWYTGPGLSSHQHDRVRVAINPGVAHSLAILDMQGKHLCEGIPVEHAAIGNAEGELMYRIEITDRLLNYLRAVTSVAETERAEMYRRLETQRITRQLAGSRNAEATKRRSDEATKGQSPVELSTMNFTGELTQDPSSSQLQDGQPCSHRGCLSHVSHPCEGCGRVAGKGQDLDAPPLDQNPACTCGACHGVADLDDIQTARDIQDPDATPLDQNPACICRASADAAHAERLRQDESQPGIDYME
ncbi:MAG TPA: hypothetical protein VLH09_10350 [Bryobacteraceae bacterium]|nr:hypothetical protein [Bryobacteraceae bacterium]